MKTLAELHFPEELRYTAEHVWVRQDGAELVAGITDFAQDQLGEISFIDLPAPGEHLDAGESFGTVESMKSVNTLFMPVAGQITAVNDTLEDSPTLTNISCYERGWLIRIRPNDAAELAQLPSAAAYTSELA